MHIRQLKIHGYRSFKDVAWEPGALNLVVGPNGSGKSNLLQLLALISDAARGNLRKSIADAGGMVPILWDHQPGSVGWVLVYDGSTSDRPNRDATYELSLRQLGGGSAYLIEHDSLVFLNEPGKEFELSKNSGYVRRATDVLKRHILLKAGELRDETVEGYEENESYFAELTMMKTDTPRSWTIHRDVNVSSGSSIRRPATTQHVVDLEAGGTNLVPVLHTLYTGNRDFKRTIDDGMRAGFGSEYDHLEFQPAAAQQIQLAVQWKSSAEPHAGQDLSDGTLRFLFLLTALAHPDPPSLVAIEEPELGLHPSMLSTVAEFAQDAAERTQVVITSHSPDFLDAFSQMSPVVTLCHWSDAQSHLYTLDAQRLNRWLEQYRLGHLFTSGELEALALPPVEPVQQANDPFADLPTEDARLSESSSHPEA